LPSLSYSPSFVIFPHSPTRRIIPTSCAPYSTARTCNEPSSSRILRRNSALLSAPARRALQRKTASATRRPRLVVESLEDRTTPTIFTVTNINDAGAGSFRQAITDANTAATNDNIVFDAAGVFATPQTINLLTVLPAISNGDLTITGTGAGNLTVRRSTSAAANFGIFSVAATTVNMVFDGLTITGGTAGSGAGITGSTQNLTVRNSVIAGNTGGTGGGIYIPTGAAGLLTVQNSTISGNSGGTGGIYFFSGGSLLVQRSTISGNTGTSTSVYHGGGIIFFGAVGGSGVTIENSTIVGNSTLSAAGGGGVNLDNVTGNVTIRNSTITGNTAPTTATGGGGVGLSGGTPTAIIESTVIAQNTGPTDGPDLRIAAGSATGTNSLIGVAPPANFSGFGNLTGTQATPLNPQLAPLQNYGGTTLTRSPLPGSPVLNAGVDFNGLPSDQRGGSFSRNFGGGVDIGAVESQPPYIPTAAVTAGNITSAGATSYPFTVTYADPTGTNIGINTSTVINNNSAVRVTGPGNYSVLATYVSIDDSSNGTPRTVNYSIVPPGGSWDPSDVGTYTIQMQGSQVANLDGTFVPVETLGTFNVAIPVIITVTNANDSGAGSLRDAIAQCSAAVSNDTILFDSTFFSTPRTISLLTALPQFSAAGGGLTITGPGAANLTVRRDPAAAAAFRIFDSTSTSLNISGLTIAGGVGTTGGGLQSVAAATINLTGVTFDGNAGTSGGGLFVSTANANVTLTNTIFTGNLVTGTGGAINMAAGTFLTMLNSTVSGNTAGTNGGGLFQSAGSVVIDNSTISGNTALGTAAGGGGAYFVGVASAAPPVGFTASTFVIRNSTINNNTSGAAGGGINLTTLTGTLQLRNDTIAGNTATTSGGGISLVTTTSAGNITLQGSTVTGNTANGATSGIGGGGIARLSTTAGTITIANSVVSGNANTNGPDILTAASGTTVNANFSAIGSNTGFTFSGTSSSNLAAGANLMLGPLANYGGSTSVRAPLPGSPLIGAGSDPLIPAGVTTDQRGGSFVRSFGGTVDIGSVESQPPFLPIALATAPTVSASGGTSYQFTVTYSDPTGTNNGINVAGIIGNNNAVRVTGPGGFNVPATYVSIDVSSNGTPRTATYSITPPGGSWDVSDNGAFVVNMQANQVADLDGNFVNASAIGSLTVAAPYIVTNADDSGAGSLRAAITSANATALSDSIAFSPTFFNVPRTISLLSVLPQFGVAGGVLAINGPGATMLTVKRDAGAATNFGILNSLAPILNLSGFTVSGGNITGDGGGLLASNLVTINGMVFSGNTATVNGGAIRINSGGFLNLVNSTISGNTAAQDGGALYFFSGGGLVVDNSTITGNISNATGVGGGALYFFGTASATPPPGFTPSTLVIRNSTIDNNTSAQGGGAITLPSFTGTLLIQNSTMAGNTAATSGGAIALLTTTSAGNITVQDSTISGNTANGGVGAGGGGIARLSTTAGTITVLNSVISGNSNANAPDILTAASGSTVNVNFSAIGSNTGFTLSGTSGNNIPFGTNLLLGPLTDNGGTTRTFAPQPTSPLINAGSDAGVPGTLTTDQRGGTLVRKFGVVDIGSVEVQPPKVAINQGVGQADLTNASPINFTVVFNAPVTGFTGSDVSFTGSTVGGTLSAAVTGSGATYNVAVTGMNGDGNVVASIPAGGAVDGTLTGNAASTSTDNSVHFDNVRPIPTINQGGSQADPTNGSPITFDVHFGESVTGFTASDIDFTGNTVGGTLVANVSGSGADYTVTVTGMNGDGTVVVSIPIDAAVDAATNTSLASTSTDNSVRFDNIAPTVTINQGASQADPTNGSPVVFDVHFSEAVTGFTGSDINFTGSTVGGTPVASVSGSGADYTVSVTGMDLQGSVNASIPASAVVDLAGNTSTASTSTDNSVQFDNIVPTATIDQAAGQADPTNGEPITFDVHFSETVTGFTGSDVSFAGSTIGGTLVANVTGSGVDYTVTVTGMNGDGNLVASIPTGGASDAAGNGNAASTSTDNSVRFDNVAPTVTIDQGSGQVDPTNGTPIVFDVHFSEVVSGFTSADIGFAGSTVGGALVAGVSGSGADYTVTVTGMSGDGNVVASIPAAAALDITGNASTASTSSDNSVRFDEIPPTVTIDQGSGQADPTNGSPIVFDVHFNELVTGFSAADVSFTGSTVGGTLSASVLGAGSDYTVQVSGMTGVGSVVTSIAAGAASDAAGNASTASTSTDNSVSFDNVSPTVTINQGSGQADLTNGSPIVFDVHFNESVTGFTAADVSFAGSTVGGTLSASVIGSGSDYTVQITGMTGVGNVVASIPAGAASDAAGNASTASTSTDNSVSFDNVKPTVTIDQGSGQADLTNASPIVFDVHFSETVTGFTAADIDFAGSTVGGTLLATVLGSGPDYTVQVTGMNGVGNVVASISAAAASDAAGNTSTASTSSDNTVSFDNVKPTVTINQGTGQADPTNGSPIVFDVHFSETVTGFIAADVSLAGSTVGGTLVASVLGAGADYTVQVTGMTGVGNVVASIPAAAAADAAGNTSTASTSTDNTVTFDNVKPTVTINQGTGQADPTNGSPIVFDVHFSETVTGFTAADVSLAGSTVGGTLVASVLGAGADYTVQITGMTGVGNVVASIPAGAAADAAGNTSTAATSTDNTVSFDNIKPTVTIDQGSGQADPTASSPVVFDVHFTENVTGFTGTDVSFAGSTVSGTLVASVSGSGKDYTVNVTGMSGVGTVVASIPAGGAVDAAGNTNTASSSTDNSVLFDNIGQLQFSAAAFATTETSGSVTITVTRANGSANAVSVQYATSNGSATAGATQDYDASSGTLSWANGEVGSKTFVINLHDDQLVEGTETINLTLSSPTGGAILGAQSTAVVQIADIEEGVLQFDPIVFTGTEDSGKATVTVTRTSGGSGPVTVDFATSDGTAHSGGSANNGQNDYTPTNGTLSWADGEAGPKTFDITILQDALNEGRETINLALTNPTGSARLGLQTTAVAAILPSDPKPAGIAFDTDEDKVTIKLTGGGTLGYFLTDADGNGKGPIELIEVSGTNPLKSVLSVTVAKGKFSVDGGTVGLGAISGTGLKSISARKANLNLEGININGYLGSLVIGNILNGADITTLASTNPLQKTSINALTIGDGTNINVGGPISNLTAIRIGAGAIVAPSIGTMLVKGQTLPTAIVGDMASTITLSGAGLATGKSALGTLTVKGSIPVGANIVAPSVGTITVKKDMAGDVTISGAGVDPKLKSLKNFKVTGTVSGSDIMVGGNVGLVQVGAFRDSRLFAGYTGPDDPIATGFNFPATVTTFKATGKIDAFQNSTVIATNFKTVVLTSLDSTNGTDKFGFYADTSLGSVKVIGPTAFKYDPNNPATQGIGDFEVRIV
jgi:Calx-beta domain/Bacterial Ig-like domain